MKEILKKLSFHDLLKGRCRPCEGGVPALSAEAAREGLKALKGWSLAEDGKSIRADYLMNDFLAVVEFIREIAKVVENEDHHPDLHLTGFRNLRVELSTHAIGGLSENDLILAAKIESLPKKLKA